MLELMCDFETLANRGKILPVSVGIAVILDSKIIDSRQWFFNVEKLISKGFLPNASTISWWLKQDEDARLALSNLLEGGHKINNGEVLGDIWAYINGNKPDMFWFNGPQFDEVILDNLFQAYDFMSPYKYSCVRDYRTYMQDHDPDYNIRNSIENDLAHDAEADAIYQSKCLIEAGLNE